MESVKAPEAKTAKGPIALQKGIIYGPVRSRRLGRSLGINLLPVSFKMCSLNCSYCQYGWTSKLTSSGRGYEEFFPSVPEVILSVKNALASIGDKIDYLTFSGNGEPTLHPKFPRIVEMVRELKVFYRVKARLALLSNGTTCGDPRVREALAKIDLAIMKLDAGNERMFRKLNHGTPPITLRQIVDGLKALPDYAIQSMFVRGQVDNSSDEQVASWIEALRELHPSQVQIYTLDRGTASEKLLRVPRSRLNEIAQQAREATGFNVEVY